MVYVSTQPDLFNIGFTTNPLGSIEWKQLEFWNTPSTASGGGGGGKDDGDSDDDVAKSRFQSALKGVLFPAEAKQALFNMYPEDYNDAIEKEKLEKAISEV